MHSTAGVIRQHKNTTSQRRQLNERVPRMGKVVFSENSNPVDCIVKKFSEANATLTMSGWLGLPSSFVLYIEPDGIRTDCHVICRKGSNIDVEFTNVTADSHYRAIA